MIATMIQLFIRFFQVGLFAIGGGMATIPFLYDMSDATGWFTYTDLANMIAVSESTPGPIGINMATYVGFLTGSKWGGAAAGVTGAVCATLGIITPSIVIILIIAPKGTIGGIFATFGIVFPSIVIISCLAGVIQQISHLEVVRHAFAGIRICVCVLILNAVVKLLRKAVIDRATGIIFLVVAAASFLTPVSPVVFVIGAALCGIILKNLGGKKP